MSKLPYVLLGVPETKVRREPVVVSGLPGTAADPVHEELAGEDEEDARDAEQLRLLEHVDPDLAGQPVPGGGERKEGRKSVNSAQHCIASADQHPDKPQAIDWPDPHTACCRMDVGEWVWTYVWGYVWG